MRKLAGLVAILGISTLVGCRAEKEEVKEANKEVVKVLPVENKVDYSSSFNDIKGCAVFFNSNENVYNIYNDELINEQVAPYSTFKIVNSLMGLSKEIVISKDSKLGYDGTKHWKEEWNKDIIFEEAFKESCVWYYKKITDSLDKEYAQETLKELNYGNSDISAWDDKGHNDFWLSSSLKISPMEQVKVLEKIFEGKTSFKPEHVEMVKDFMLIEENEEYSVYGKTGSAKNTTAWFTGFVEKDNEKTYFAVRLKDEKQNLAGAKAKEIALDIIKNSFE